VNWISPAEQHLRSLGVTDPRDIDLEAIAYDAGALVRYEPLDGCEARIIGLGDRAVISVDPSRGHRRKRFSTGHELGHWRYHRGKSFKCRPEDIGAHVLAETHPERVADAYSADLLLPGYLFKPLARQFRHSTLEAVDSLADAFDVSITATARRMIDWGPEPAILICHTAHGRKWFHRNRDIPTRWFPRDDLDAESVVFDVLHGKKGRSRRTLTGADAWFDRRDADRFEVYEQAIQVVDGEVLALVVLKSPEMME
jgi:hypothetical protein